MTWTKAGLAAVFALALAGCNVTNPRLGAGVSVGTDGVHVSPYAGANIGRAHVGVGL